MKGKLPRTVPCGGREAAYDAFVTAIKNPKNGEYSLLLVDSETQIADHTAIWDHLKAREGDNWDRPETAEENHVFLMVQVMETWFIADRTALKKFFGQGFREQAIPAWPDLEKVPKIKVYEALASASAQCSKTYAKGRISFDMLALTSPLKVQEAGKHARRLFDRLRGL